MNSYVDIKKIVINNDCKKQLERLFQLYIRHEFDLLGSGLIKIDYKIDAKGFFGRKYYNRSMFLYEKLANKKLKNKCTDSYKPINWFVDYKSGFFFAPYKYSTQAKCNKVITEKKGVDIKCPWEFGRFYHLLQLSLLAIADVTLRDNIILEFKNEIIDFIVMNPINRGVQWAAPMDVSIRTVNILLAYDILIQLDTRGYLDKNFQVFVEDHIRKTLDFIMAKLEYLGRISANHYLSNLAGIIFAASYLERSKYTDSCLVFGVQELIDQVEKQFYEEGSHFEGSTSYHRLSTEFVLYPTALVYGLLKTERKDAFAKYDKRIIKRLKDRKVQKYNLNSTVFFPVQFIDRLCNAGVFTNKILKENNEIVQIGDNDSGRLVKLTPLTVPSHMCIEENILDHRTLLSAMNGMFLNEEFTESSSDLPLESSFIYSLSKQKQFKGNIYVSSVSIDGNEADRRLNCTYEYSKSTLLFQDDKNSLLDGLNINYFEQFGLVVFKGNRLFLCMVIDTARNAVFTGHTHNDKLSIEIMIDGKYITRDAGGYIYTASTKIRDKFRSIKAHNTICIDGCEQNEFTGIWEMKKKAKAELLYCNRNRVAVKLNYDNIECLREICLSGNKIIVNDFANKPFKVSFHNRLYSDGYGKLKRVM